MRERPIHEWDQSSQVGRRICLHFASSQVFNLSFSRSLSRRFAIAALPVTNCSFCNSTR